MKKILLAISGTSPRREAIKFALGLARRVKAHLSVLQVIRPADKQGKSNFMFKLQNVSRDLEEAMVEVTFAETGEHDLIRRQRRKLEHAAAEEDIDIEESGSQIEYDFSVSVGEMKDEVSLFVKKHPEAVLAVYDGPNSKEQEKGLMPLPADLPIPLVSLEKRKNIERGNKMSEVVLKKKSEFTKAAEKLERYNEAVAFAEGGMPEEAVRILSELKVERKMLLVWGRWHTFSEPLKDYAVGLAKRLDYEIVAVNNKYLPKDFIPLVSKYREKLREDFAVMASESARDFEAQCREAGVKFTHLVKFGDSSEVIKDLHREYRRLDYVVSEPDENVETVPGVAPAIPVFSLNFA